MIKCGTKLSTPVCSDTGFTLENPFLLSWSSQIAVKVEQVEDVTELFRASLSYTNNAPLIN